MMHDPLGDIERRLRRLEAMAQMRPDRIFSDTGTWTPTVIGTTSAGTATYSVQIGQYVQTGTIVIAMLFLTWTGHTGTGNMTVSLPMAATALTSIRFSVPVWLDSIAFTGAHVQGQIVAGNDAINLEAVAATGTRTAIPMDAAGSLIITATYLY
jgi:hypothetical protein